ncbi:helix-turn-helix domain-containing protein [Deefgea piscis]|uniref:helix-turn-helix domain-containing protein n=1 Tax=Deefgea piscis TaxID=2739061 RepID=UPI001C81F2C9|nr:helix-turn-helix transcriptional regulator [Deefgea piscis]QZA82244.1 helix-turn-helix domain-containing protein [Deefgea piscis]
MQMNLTPEEMESELGERLKRLRVNRNLEQATVAERAGISVRALRNLESGNGSSLNTLVRVLRALGKEQWLETIAPIATIDPLMLTRAAIPRQRASKPRTKTKENNGKSSEK